MHTVKGFGTVNKAEIGVFLELSCFFDDPADVGNLISGSSAFSKTSLNIWKFMVHILLQPGLESMLGVFKLFFFFVKKSLCGTWDFTSPTRDQTRRSCCGDPVLMAGPPGMCPNYTFLITIFSLYHVFSNL